VELKRRSFLDTRLREYDSDFTAASGT